MVLSEINPGTPVTITKVDAGRGLAGRIAALGLLPGTAVTVTVNDKKGPVVVAVKESKVALGRGMAEKIEVTLL